MKKVLEIKKGGNTFQMDLWAIAHYRAFSSFNQTSASVRRNCTS
jgi:hypothetical protein